MVEDGTSSLFDRVLVVSFNAASTKPEVTYTFPPPTQGKDSKDIDSVSEFCYPEAHSELLLKINSSDYTSETFSFVLTDSLGGKTYGYCRRFRAEKELECFCILSHIPSFSLFSQILDIVESRRKVSTTLVYSFLKTVLAQIFPAPGQTLSIKTFSASKTGEMDVYNLTRPNDEFLTAYVSFYNLFHWLSLEDILKVWEYMLCERRVIFCSRHLGTLSSCINALCALLYPFSWQHIFIPILPQSLIHFVTAPMPFLCGILSSSKNTLNGFPLDEVIMLDLDEKEFTLDYPFERVLPIAQFCTLKNNLRKLMKSGKRGKEFDQEVAKYFLLFFYTIFRDYKKYITPAKPLPATPVPEVKEQNSKKKVVRRKPKGDFDRAAFIKSQNDESTQKFLELFGSSQMFETFILEREEAAVVGSATLPDCSFLTLCSSTLHENLYVGTVECERCGKGLPLRHTCNYENWHFHPQCFECKRCHGTLVYDDFNEVVVQVNATSQDPATKVRTICASCEATGGNAASSASSFLRRMKHAVAKKIDLGTSGTKKEEDKTPEKPKPTPPPAALPAPPPPVAQVASPVSQEKEKRRERRETVVIKINGKERQIEVPPAPLHRDTENEKRISVALQGQVDAQINGRQTLPPSKFLEFPNRAKFKSMQLHREPGTPCIFFEKFEPKLSPATKRKSKSDIFPINERVKQEVAKASVDDSAIDAIKQEERNRKIEEEENKQLAENIQLEESQLEHNDNTHKDANSLDENQLEKNIQLDENHVQENIQLEANITLEENDQLENQLKENNKLEENTQLEGNDKLEENIHQLKSAENRRTVTFQVEKPPPSPKPLPVAPRAPRNKLVPPDPTIVKSSPNLSQTTPPPVTKPRSGSGSGSGSSSSSSSGSASTPRPNIVPACFALDPPSVTPPATKPRSGSFGRGQTTTPSGQSTPHAQTPHPVTHAPTPRPTTSSQPTSYVPTPRPITPGQSTNSQSQTSRSGSISTKPRSGSVGRPSYAPSAEPASGSQPTTTTKSTTARPRSGSVGRPIPESEGAGSSLMSHHRSPLSNSSLSLYKPYPVPRPDVKPKQLPTPPTSGAAAHRAEANNSKNNSSNTPITTSNNSNAPTTGTVSSIVNAANKPNPPLSFNKPVTPPGSQRPKPAARAQNSFTGPSIGSHHPVPVLMKSKSVPDSRKTNVVLDEPPSHVCTLCKKPFSSPNDSKDTPYRIVSTNDAFYHPACFVCAHCGKAIDTAYVTRDRRAYHRDCAAKIAHTCNICNKPILSQYLEFQGKIIHKECFTCVSCKEPLAKVGSKYVELDGHSYCLDCTKNRPTKS